MVGVDSAVALLQQARQLGLERDLPAHWVRGDIRDLPLRQESCAAVVLIDAFGFFEADDENERVLAEAMRIVVPGGFLAMKVVNGEPILASFRPTDREDRQGVVVTISRTLTGEPARLLERVSISGPRGDGQYERRQRLYRVGDLLAAAKRVGFTSAEVFADAHGATFEPAASPTMWVIGQRAHAV